MLGSISGRWGARERKGLEVCVFDVWGSGCLGWFSRDVDGNVNDGVVAMSDADKEEARSRAKREPSQTPRVLHSTPFKTDSAHVHFFFSRNHAAILASILTYKCLGATVLQVVDGREAGLKRQRARREAVVSLRDAR